jgi:hypothetical protein
LIKSIKDIETETKAQDPVECTDEVPNGPIEADNKTKQIYLIAVNQVYETEDISKEWQE